MTSRGPGGARAARLVAYKLLSATLVAASLLAVSPPSGQALERPFDADLVGVFEFGACPPHSPAGALCLHDTVSGPISGLGPATGEFDVAIDSAAGGPDGCAPVTKVGYFLIATDRLDVTASGRYCFATSTASYVFSINGGTGALAGTAGSGSWIVPQPSSLNAGGGEGSEQVRGTISYPEPGSTPATSPSGGTGDRARLRIGRIELPGSEVKSSLRARAFSNGQPVHGVVLSIRRGSRRGPEVGRSRRFSVTTEQDVMVPLASPLKAGSAYAAVLNGRDQFGDRLTAVRMFHSASHGGR